MNCTCNQRNVAKHKESGLSWANKLIDQVNLHGQNTCQEGKQNLQLTKVGKALYEYYR